MRKLTLLAAAGAAMFTLAACGGNSGTNTQTTAAPAETTAAESAAPEAPAPAEGTDKPTPAETVAGQAPTAGKTFTVGFDQDFPPMGFVGDDGQYTGFDLELAEEVAKRLGLEYKPQPIAWDAKDMELESGTIDCIWNGFTITGREDSYTWTDPYMDNSQVFVVAKDSGINTLADLSGKIVEVQTDSSAEAALTNESADLATTFGQLLTVADYNTAFMDLEQGAVDAIAMDVIVAGYQIEQRKADFVMLDETLSSEEYGVGFKKGNTELRDQVQTTLEDMAKDGTLKTISEKWFGKDVTIIGK